MLTSILPPAGRCNWLGSVCGKIDDTSVPHAERQPFPTLNLALHEWGSKMSVGD